MKSFVHLLVIISSVVAIAACGKTDQQKAKDNVESSKTAIESSTREIGAMGAPSSTWSDEKLNRFETLINSFESSANSIEAQNGKDGIVILDIGSMPKVRSIISNLRLGLSNARSNKKSEALKAKYNGHYEKLRLAGAPSESWSVQQLDQYEVELTALEQTAVEINSKTATGISDQEKSMKWTSELHELVGKLRAAKIVKPAA